MELTMSQRQAVTKKMAFAYRDASRAGKGRILDELVGLTGWHRDYARAALREALVLREVRPRPPRPPVYGPRVIAALERCWAVLRATAGKRLAPILPALVPMLRREGELELTDEEALLCRMSAATIDRRLGPARCRMVLRGRSHTKPGSLLKSQIPVRTWADWDEGVPGFVEIDLVGHEGGLARGEFCFTLTVTDVATGWSVNRSVPNKAHKWVLAAIEHAVGLFPFPVLGIDSDNGSEFVNAALLGWCEERQITFTRSRPGNKNDGAYVEQKNWSRVRELVGYYRYDTAAELAKLNEIWELDAVFANYLLPQQKLVHKQRHGAKVVKKHDAAQTPHQRAIAHPAVRKRPVITMNAAFKRLRPAALSRQILALTAELEALAQAKPAPRIQGVNPDWNTGLNRRKPREATNQSSRSFSSEATIQASRRS